jgi:exonuclease III
MIIGLFLVIIIVTPVIAFVLLNTNIEVPNERPTITVSNPTPGSSYDGILSIEFEIVDEESLNASIYFDGVFMTSERESHSFDTTNIPDGTHTLRFEVEDSEGFSVTRVFEIIIDNYEDIPIIFDGNLTTMVYNIKESGLNDDWKTVVKNENPDVLILVETGYLEDHANESFNAVVSELNGYFINESHYYGICAQNIRYSTSGEAILSRYPIKSFTQIDKVILDDDSEYYVTHDFIHAVITVNGTDINVIGGHLKASAGENEEWRRERETEGIINYMDDLGNVPILYLSDQNSFSPYDNGTLSPVGQDLGYGPMTMMLNPLDSVYGNYSSKIHNFTDVFRELNPLDPGYTFGIDSVTTSWRIDYIIINQFFEDKILDARVISQPPSNTASDHYAVFAILSW